jgi:hypothetical protein
MKLNVMSCKKRGEPAIDIARATQIPDIMIHITLKSAQGVETKAVKPLEGENYMPKVLCNGGFGVASRNMNRELYQHPLKQMPVRLYKAVKEDSAILAKGAEFQDVSEGNIVELLESISFPLSYEELAEVDRQTYEYKEAQDDLNDEKVISEENTLTVKRFKRNLHKIIEAVDYFGTMIPFYGHSAKDECGVEDVLSCSKEILQKEENNVGWNPKKSAKCRPFREE